MSSIMDIKMAHAVNISFWDESEPTETDKLAG
jgi:hypothetical protein